MLPVRFAVPSLALVAALAAGAANASPTTFFSDDYDGGQTIAGGVSVTVAPSPALGTVLGGPYNGSAGKAWNGSFLQNQTAGNPAGFTTYTFSGLGAHNQITLDFMLGLLNSWDSTNGSPAPDFFEVWVDGNMVAQLTTTNASGSVVSLAGGTQLVNNGQIDTNQFFSDDLVDMGSSSAMSFAHSASTLTVGFRASGAGWQGGTDEYWGIDAFSVSGDNVVPEPTPLALLGLAALVAGGLRSRRAGRAG